MKIQSEEAGKKEREKIKRLVVNAGCTSDRGDLD
jgi:hypothetical protein